TPAAHQAHTGTRTLRRGRREWDPSGLEQPDVGSHVLRLDREEVGSSLVATDDDVEDEAVENVGLRPSDSDLRGAPYRPQGSRRAEQPAPRSTPVALGHQSP